MLRDRWQSQRIFIIIILLLITGTLVFIFTNSLADREKSFRQVDTVRAIVTPLLEIFTGKGNVTDHIIRKSAHFCEFALLGFLMGTVLAEICRNPLLFHHDSGALRRNNTAIHRTGTPGTGCMAGFRREYCRLSGGLDGMEAGAADTEKEKNA